MVLGQDGRLFRAILRRLRCCGLGNGVQGLDSHWRSTEKVDEVFLEDDLPLEQALGQGGQFVLVRLENFTGLGVGALDDGPGLLVDDAGGLLTVGLGERGFGRGS